MNGSCLLMLVGTLVGLPPGAAAAGKRTYALIVANNRGLDKETQPLAYADDDGAKYFELFSALGAETSLFAVLDPDAQSAFPRATRAAKPPYREAVLSRAKEMFAEMRRDRTQGIETELYFVYSGHGHVGPNNEGLLSLLDGPLGRSDLYRDIIAPSPATWNHVIIDACNAYFVVNKRGASHKKGDYATAVQRYLDQEELANYPNTGVILAASSESETHEWSRWKSGIFSHELRSALLGAADVDEDRRITYAEAATAIEAANATIPDERARLRVYARPPAARIDQPLVLLADFAAPARVAFPAREAHVHVEDARGVRVADLHRSAEASFELVLLGEPPFFVREESREAKVLASEAPVAFDALPFAPREMASRGSVEQSFRKALFSTPFGPSFYQGALAVRGPASAGWNGWFGSVEEPPSLYLQEPERRASVSATLGWTALSTGAVSMITGGICGYLASRSYKDYLAATDPQTVKQLKGTTHDQQIAANTLLISGGALAATGLTFLLYHWLRGDEGSQSTDSLALSPTAGGGAVAWQLRF